MLALLTPKAADSREMLEMFVVRMLRDPPTPYEVRVRAGGSNVANV